jgi:hypothetical protein
VKNWRTTTAGILSLASTAALVIGKILAGEQLDADDVAALSAALAAAGLIFAKDSNK